MLDNSDLELDVTTTDELLAEIGLDPYTIRKDPDRSRRRRDALLG